MSITGNGKPLARFRSNWFVTMHVGSARELGRDGWHVTIEGGTSFDKK